MTSPVQVYASLEQFKEYRMSRNQTVTEDDNLIMGFLRQAARDWNELTRHLFYPHILTKSFDHPGGGGYGDNYYNQAGPYLGVAVAGIGEASRLKLKDDLLEIITFTTNNGNDTLSASDYFLMTGDRYDLYPYDRICMRIDGNYPALLFSDTPQKANQITGIWGYHDDWDNAWRASGDTITNPLLGTPANGAVETITVTDVDAASPDGITPVFQTGQLWRIESEYLYVVSTNKTNNTVEAARGVHGSTVAAHDAATAIEIFRPIEDARFYSLRLADYNYTLKDSKDPTMDRRITTPTGLTMQPATLPSDAVKAATRYNAVFR